MKGGPGRPLTRALALIAGALGLGALRRALRRGRPEVDPAAGLRAKLDEARRTPAPPVPEEPVETGAVEDSPVAAAEPAPVPETAETEADPGKPDVDRRREDVHARARRAIDELRS